MEFLLGRSLANNVTNALLWDLAAEKIREKGIDPLLLVEEEPDAGLGNGALAVWLHASSIRWQPWESGMGYGLRYESASSSRL